jgi:CHAD domain-containing protein
MAYAIHFDRCLNEERKRIAVEQVDKALAELRDDSLALHARVHQFRKRAKKVRALLRLFRPAKETWYQRENVRFRDLASQYSALRDADAAIDTLGKVTQHFNEQLDTGVFIPLQEALFTNEKIRIEQDISDTQLVGLQSELEATRDEIAAWADHRMSHADLLEGFEKTYRRGRKAMRKCEETNDATIWHEWRKRAKYQRYQWKLLRQLWPPVINCWRDQYHRLTDMLGEDHDLIVLRELLRSRDTPCCDQVSLEALEGLTRERSTALRDSSKSLGRKLFYDEPKAVRQRLHCWMNL